MFDRAALDSDSVFHERNLVEPGGKFVAWDSPLGCAARETDEEAKPVEPGFDIEAIRTQAFADGFEQGCKTVDAEVAAEREALAALTESLHALQPEPNDALAEMLAATVERLVCQIVGEVPINPVSLVKRAEAAAKLIGDELDPSRLRVNPEDLALFARSRVPVEIVGDSSIERGSLRLEWGRGWIEDGPAVRLARLRAALDEIGAK